MPKPLVYNDAIIVQQIKIKVIIHRYKITQIKDMYFYARIVLLATRAASDARAKDV